MPNAAPAIHPGYLNPGPAAQWRHCGACEVQWHVSGGPVCFLDPTHDGAAGPLVEVCPHGAVPSCCDVCDNQDPEDFGEDLAAMLEALR